MSIQYAILSLLSIRPLSGYDLKKVISDSAAFPWSGNNNQIYRSLVELHENGLVTQDVVVQTNLPARKVYTITEAGRNALKAWALSAQDLPEVHNTFLIRLLCTPLMTPDEVHTLLDTYEQEVRVQLLMQQEKGRRSTDTLARDRKETFLWAMIQQNVIMAYENELQWIERVRAGLAQFL